MVEPFSSVLASRNTPKCEVGSVPKTPFVNGRNFRVFKGNRLYVPSTEIRMPRVVLGTVEIGRRRLKQDERSHAIIDYFLLKGYNEVDTAPVYCDGDTERIIGRMPSYCDPKKVEVATKANPWGDNNLKREGLMSQIEQSLKSLQVPCLDIFYLHAPDHDTPIEETLSVVQELYKASKFKEFGLSNYSSWQVADIYHLCEKNGWVLPTVYQGMYNGVCRMVEQELFPCLRSFNIRFYAYNVLAGGILTGRFNSEAIEDPNCKEDGKFFMKHPWTKGYRDRFWRKELFEAISFIQMALHKAYDKGTVTMAEAALQWINHHSKLESNDGIILGASSLEQLKNNLAAVEKGPLEDSVVRAFDHAWNLDKANCAPYFR